MGSGICACPAQLGARVKSRQGRDIYRIDDLIKTADGWRKAEVLQYAFAPGDAEGQMWTRGERVRRGTAASAGRSAAAYGDQTKEGRRGLGYVSVLASSALRSPCRLLRWTSKFIRKRAEGSLGGEVYSFCEMVGHVALLREFYARLANLSRGIVGLGDFAGPCPMSETKRPSPRSAQVHHLLGIKQASGSGWPGNVYGFTGPENPPDCPSKVKSDMATLLHMLKSGACCAGVLRPLRRVTFVEGPNA